MNIESSKSQQFSNPKADPELEQYYQWSDHPTSLQYDRIGDRFVNIGSFPFYQEIPSLPVSELLSVPEEIKSYQNTL